MLPNDDLIRWGEPPADEAEMALADRLAEALAGPSPGDSFHGAPPEAAAPPELRLRVLREAGPGRFVAVASTHAAPMALRDLRRVPDDADRVYLRTGDRVRLEVVCDTPGYLTVL